jgi:hypothetical protein
MLLTQRIDAKDHAQQLEHVPTLGRKVRVLVDDTASSMWAQLASTTA